MAYQKNVAIPRAEKYLKQLGLWEKCNNPSMQLSGGMKRRLMIARALIHEPEILILDEPTAGVDIELRRSMWTFIKELNKQGTTIILTTHYLEEAEQLCRNIAIINKGNIIENTSVKALLKTLSQETFILDLESLQSTEIIIDGFNVRVVEGSHSIEVDVEMGQSINKVFEALNTQGLQVLSMRNKSNRLEELFVKLTED